MDKTEEDQRSAELQRLNKKVFQERQEQKAALKQKEAEDSFYQKLSDGFDVNVLIVGDSIGAGAGAQSDGTEWFGQLQAYLQTIDKGNISFTNISMGGNASYAGYVRTMALNDGIDYDLAIICYGQKRRYRWFFYKLRIDYSRDQKQIPRLFYYFYSRILST